MHRARLYSVIKCTSTRLPKVILANVQFDGSHSRRDHQASRPSALENRAAVRLQTEKRKQKSVSCYWDIVIMHTHARYLAGTKFEQYTMRTAFEVKTRTKNSIITYITSEIVQTNFINGTITPYYIHIYIYNTKHERYDIYNRIICIYTPIGSTSARSNVF